jgi:hypothetical protein
MTYKRAVTFGWAIAWRSWWWSIVVVLPPMLVAVFAIHRAVPLADGERAFRLVAIPLFLVLELLAVLPQSIRGAVPSAYSDFRVSVARPDGRNSGLRYLEALQVSLPAFLIYVGLSLLYGRLQLGGLLTLAQIPFQVLLVFPAIAAALVRTPFRGFRIAIVPKGDTRQDLLPNGPAG